MNRDPAYRSGLTATNWSTWPQRNSKWGPLRTPRLRLATLSLPLCRKLMYSPDSAMSKAPAGGRTQVRPYPKPIRCRVCQREFKDFVHPDEELVFVRYFQRLPLFVPGKEDPLEEFDSQYFDHHCYALHVKHETDQVVKKTYKAFLELSN